MPLLLVLAIGAVQLLPCPVSSAATPGRLPAPCPAGETLHYDGPNETGIGMSGGGWFMAATRFTVPYRCVLRAVIFYQFDYIVDEHVFLWGPRNDSTPGAKWDSLLYLPQNPGSWLRVDLREPRIIEAGDDFWAGPQVACGPDRYPAGVDEGPATPRRNFIYWSEAVGWKELPAVGVYRNWNVRAIISRADPHDIGPLRILAPSGQVWPRALEPAVSVFNFGEFDESNIEVTCWIDSAGTRVYNRSTTYAGPLWPGESTAVRLPAWQPGPVGSEYDITVFTRVAGDDNYGNDTLYSTTVVAAAAFSDTLVVRRIASGPPTIDGIVDPQEWARAAAYDVSDTAGRGLVPRQPGSCIVRFLADNSFLYAACEMPPVSSRNEGDFFALCTDEDHSGTWNRTDSCEGRHTAVRTGGQDSLVFEAILTTLPYLWRLPGQCPDAYSASSTSGGYLQFEAKMPFGPRRGDLTITPGDTAGVFFYSMAGYGTDCYGWWPQHITQGNWANAALYGTMVFESQVAAKEQEERSLPVLQVTSPARGMVRLSCRLSAPQTPRLLVHSSAGTLVRRIDCGLRFAGDQQFAWDGRMANGDPAACGAYYLTLESGSRTLGSARVILLR